MKTSEATAPNIQPSKPLRLADRLRLDTCFNAVVQDRRIVVLHSAYPGVLEHHASLLIERLQSHGGAAVEHFSSVNSEVLLSRMNAVLADLSVAQATRPTAPPALQRIWVVLDAHTLPASDTQLLIQLLKNFPGAGLTALLVYQGKNLPQYLVDAQGTRLLTWAIEAEPEDMADAPVVGPARQMAAPAPQTAPAKPRQSKPRQNRILVAGVLLTLVLSALGAALMQPDASLQLWSQMKLATLEFIQKLAPEKVSAPAESLANESPVAAANPAPAAATLPSSEKSAPAGGAASSEVAPAAVAAPATASSESAVQGANPAITETRPAEPPAPLAKPAKAPAPLPKIARRDLQWLQKLPEDVFLVAHGVYDDFAAAQQTMQDKPFLANARLVPVLVGATQRHEYLVVTGPFKTQARVKAYITRLKLSPKGKAVTSADLRKYMTLRKEDQEAQAPRR